MFFYLFGFCLSCNFLTINIFHINTSSVYSRFFFTDKHSNWHRLYSSQGQRLVFCFTDPTKFFGCELGAQTQFDAKNDRYIVNGSHTGEKLQTLLDGFIKKFVLCPECSNPETNLVSCRNFF